MMLPILENRKTEFSIALYQEHLTECGFLLSQRARYFEDSTLSWLDVADLEQRLDTHLHGLDTGGKLARNAAIELLASADQDLLLGAVYALATLGRDDAGLPALIEAFEKADDALLWCFVEGCKQGKHPGLNSHLLPLLAHARAPVRLAVADVFGYRRQGDAKRIWPLLNDVDPGVRQAAAVACARYGNRGALAAVEQLAYSTGLLPEQYVLPLLCLGSSRALQDCRSDCTKAASTSPVKLLALGLAGSEQDLALLFSKKHSPDLAPIVLKAIGIHGHGQAIPRLLDALNSADDAIKRPAAEALDLITGAGLRETVEVAEVEEEVAPNEALGAPAAEKKSTDEQPMPTLRTIERLCADPARWSQWWQQHQKEFQSGVRFRHGKPFNLGVCIDALAHPHTSCETRQLTSLELVIRSGQAIGFEPDWFIEAQGNAIHAWQNWWGTAMNSDAAQPWVFAGR